jgi:outer membrane protein
MRRVGFFIASVIFCGTVSHAQNKVENASAPGKVLTFNDAVKIAVQNSILLNQQRNNFDFAQAQRLQSIAGIGPNVTLNGSIARREGNTFNNNTGTLVNGVIDQVNGSINANINLFSGFNRVNQVKQFARQLDAQAYFVGRTSQDVINTIAAQYLNVMLDVELLKIARQNFEALDKQLLQVRESVNLGARSPVDEYNQDALTKAAQLNMVNAEITLNNDKTLLTQTLLIDPFEAYDVEKPVWDLNTLGYDSLDVTQLVETAKQYRGDYLRAVKQEEAGKFATRAARGLMAPQLFAFFNYGSAYNFQHNVKDSVDNVVPIIIQDPSAASGYSLSQTVQGKAYNKNQIPRSFENQFRGDNVFKTYGLQLTIPVFQGFQNRTTMLQQKVLYENAQLNRKNLEYQIKNDVIRAIRNFDGAKKAYQISVDQLNAADVAFQLETERYNLGVTNFVDFTNANRALVLAQTSKAQAEYRLVFQRIAIEYAVGSLKAEQLE